VRYDVADVIAWLPSLGFDEDKTKAYQKLFRRNAVDGTKLAYLPKSMSLKYEPASEPLHRIAPIETGTRTIEELMTRRARLLPPRETCAARRSRDPAMFQSDSVSPIRGALLRSEVD